MEGYLSHLRYRGVGFGPASIDVTVFVDSPWEVFLRSEWEVGRGKGARGKGMEKKLGLVCKKILFYKIK